MPKVEQAQGNQVQSQVIAQPLAKGAPSGAFGADLGQSAIDLVQAGAALKNRVDTTSAEEALVGFERDKNDLFFNPDSGYFNTQGRNAYDNSSAATESLNELKKQYGESLGTEARTMFDRAADAHITRGQVDITRHSAKGLKAWEVATLESQVENTIENASLYWNDPDRLKVQNALGRQAVIDSADMAGIGAEAKAEKLQTYDSAFASSTVEAATANSAAAGTEAMEKVGDRLEGPDKVKLEKAIEQKAKTEKTQADATAAVLTANKLVGQYDNRADIMEEVNKIEDPALRKKTMTESMSQFNQRKNAKKEVQNDNYQAAIADVNNGLSPMQIQASNPQAWEGMSDTQRNNILSGKHVITDQILFNRLRMLPTNEKADLNPADYADQLRPTDLQKLTTEVNAAKKGDTGSRVKSLSSKSMAAAESAFGKKSKWVRQSGQATERGKRANEFLTSLQDAIDEFETDKGSRITPSEENQLIGEYTRQLVVERSALGLDFLAPDIKIDMSNTPAEDVRTLNQIVDATPNINVVDLTEAYQFLVDNGQPVTPNSLRLVYDQGTK